MSESTGRLPYGELNPDYHDHSERYVKVWAVLVILLVGSVIGPVVGDFTGIKMITLMAAFGIAVIKAGLVIKEFMHINVEPAVVHYILITALVFMALFFSAVAPDVMNHEGTNWENVAAKAATARGLAAGSGHGAEHGDDAEGQHGDAGHGGGH